MKKNSAFRPKQRLALTIQMSSKSRRFPFLVTRGGQVVGQVDSVRNAHGLLLWVSFMDLLNTEIERQRRQTRVTKVR